MIKLLRAHIEEVRGIRSLDVDFRGSTFAISGPNGSGKSGVIDAIEFALTGEIGRLTGSGTKGLSIREHGPHVDKTRYPGAAFVELSVVLPQSGKQATIKRALSAPSKPVIEPSDPDVMAAITQLGSHPEITLSRRELLRFILVEPSKRGDEIQALLKLDDIGQTRSALSAAQNRLRHDLSSYTDRADSLKDGLARHLQVTNLTAAQVLRVINPKRRILGLPDLEEIARDTKLDDGLAVKNVKPPLNRQSSLRDVQALADQMAQLPDLGKSETQQILADIEALETHPELLESIERHGFWQRGLDLVIGPACPLCDAAWDEAELRRHLTDKLQRAVDAQLVRKRLADGSARLAAAAGRTIDVIVPVLQIANILGKETLVEAANHWKSDLAVFIKTLGSTQGIVGLRDRLAKGWANVPPLLATDLALLAAELEAAPDQSATADAQTFLTTAQIRLEDYRAGMRQKTSAERSFAAATAAHDLYCAVLEEELDALYADVEQDFSEYYRLLNSGDEDSFTAKFTPEARKLDLLVDFYARGLFPPGAYHSEGHQDGMGVCLYLALMKRLYGGEFTVALLDDVVMSVDSAHRYEFCKLLNREFPNTQFIITTHDRVWAEQMKSAGLVTGNTSLVFHGWSIDTGPLVESDEGIWKEIHAEMAKGKVEVAAAALRRHLEFVSRLLADQLGAQVTFRADGNYELGDLLPAVLHRIKELYGKAAAAAQSWGDLEAAKVVADRKRGLVESNEATMVDQWAVNRAVHYNEWANLGRRDFEPVVNAFNHLLAQFRCESCSCLLHVTPRVRPESLRCDCGKTSLNLRRRP